MKTMTQTLIAIICGLFSLACYAENDDWYQIELIIFRSLSETAINSEKWPDFLYPPSFDKSITLVEPTIEESRVAVPYSLVPETQLQLTEIAKRVEISDQHQLIRHFAWIQPGNSQEETFAIQIREGETMLITPPPPEPVIDLEKIGLESDSDSLYQNNNDNETYAPPSETTISTNETNPALDGEPEEISPDKYSDTEGNDDQFSVSALPENSSYMIVNQLEGTIMVYRERYLHILTDLVYREPRYPEATAYSDSYEKTETSTTSENDNDTSKYKDSVVSDETADEQVNSPSYTVSTIDIPVKNRRRMRSDELHYIDHPVIGVIIKAIKYTPPEPEASDALNNTPQPALQGQ